MVLERFYDRLVLVNQTASWRDFMTFDHLVWPGAAIIVALLLGWAGFRRSRSLQRSTHRTVRKMAEYGGISIALLGAMLIAGSSVFNAVATYRFWKVHPPAGRLLSVNGHIMHLNCTGQGSPTLVLEAGLGNDSLIWAGIQPELSKTTQVCSYDRSGLGWSEPSSEARDAEHIAEHLHALLTTAGITGPLVLSGHSIGGLYVREYATRFPEQVVGLVFIDSSTPWQDQIPAIAAVSRLPPQWLLHLAFKVGAPRMAGMCSGSRGGNPSSVEVLQAEDTCRLNISEPADEINNFGLSSLEVMHQTSYGSLPLLVLSQDPQRPVATGDQAKPERTAQVTWNALQEKLKRLSSRSYRIIARRSTHYIQLDRPDLVEKEVSLFLQQIRGAKKMDSYGSTTME